MKDIYIKCYCGHTTTCDCEPEELKQVLGVDFEMSIDDDGMSIMIPITKQETLEEAAKKYATDMGGDFHQGIYNAFKYGTKWQQEQEKVTTDDAYNEGFKNGKHWQQERMYSEEKVVEKDYEILSYIHNGSKHIWKKDSQLKDTFCLEDGKSPFTRLEDILKYPKIYLIHSVKRNDGEIFTIGDKVTCQDCIGEIKEFFMCGVINIKGVGTKDDPNMPWSFPLTELWDDMTELPQKVKKPLFTTEQVKELVKQKK